MALEATLLLSATLQIWREFRSLGMSMRSRPVDISEERSSRESRTFRTTMPYCGSIFHLLLYFLIPEESLPVTEVLCCVVFAGIHAAKISLTHAGLFLRS